MARPTKYNPSFVEELDKYLMTTGKEQTSLPTIQGFALHLNVDSDTLNNWASYKDEKGELLYPEFFGTLRRLKELQAKQLIDDGIYGGKEVNATIIKLLLQNNHGMKEKSETEIKYNISINMDELIGLSKTTKETANSNTDTV